MKKMKEKRLFLVDAMAVLFRSYYALIRNPLYNSKGFNTSAIYGFANALLELITTQKPSHMAVAFDTKGPTHREVEFANYKANRPPAPEDLIKSIEPTKKLIELMNIPTIEIQGYEADDIIGTLAKETEKDGYTVFIVSPDKDFGQLVSQNILLYRPSAGNKEKEIWDVKKVCERYGIERPEQLIDILALMGDQADNIPGVHGIGEKTAMQLIQQFGSIENLYENIDKITSPSVKRKLIEGKELAFLSKQLATIQLNVPIDIKFSELEWKIPSYKDLQDFFDELEFKTFSKRFWEAMQNLTEEKPSLQVNQPTLFDQEFIPIDERRQVFADIHSTPHTYKRIEVLNELKEWLSGVTDKLCFDLETSSLDPYEARIVGIALSYQPHDACFVPTENQLNDVLFLLKPYFENPNITKIGHNLKFDLSVLKTHGITVSPPCFDTMIAHYLLDPEKKHGMDYLSEIYLKYKTITYDEMMDKKKNIQEVDAQKLSDYACEDADITLQLYHIFLPKLKEKELEHLMYEVEMPLVEVLMDMELTGVAIDTDALKELSKQLEEDIHQIEREIYELAGAEFNINSPKQLGEILYEKLQIADKPQKTKKTKQYSTAEETLQKYVHVHPIVNKILDYRELVKLKSTYIDAFPSMVHPKTGRIHTNFNQTITSTGRLSSSQPNLQNIPIRTQRGREIRKVFIPSKKENYILSADYSQIELRIVASISEDENMMKAFIEGKDIHAATAAQIYGVEESLVTSEMRRVAKTVNFGLLYGMTTYGLAERLGISPKEAKAITEAYFKKFPGIKRYMEEAKAFAREHGYVQTLLKRRRYLPDIHSSNPTVRGLAERIAINMPIQGTAADMIKLAMIRIHKLLNQSYPEAKLILQVHDELIFDVPEKDVDSFIPAIIDIMKNALPLKVPIEVSVGKGKNWLEAHE